jgi:uncharacterized protein (DUF433 family)
LSSIDEGRNSYSFFICIMATLIRQTRIPVWLLVSLRDQGASEAYLLEDYPTLTASDLVNAWLYTEAYPEEIEAAIARQEAA